VATIAALVLGLLIASAKTSYDTQRSEMQTISVDIIELDRILSHFGPGAAEPRDLLHKAVTTAYNRIWSRGLVQVPDPGTRVAWRESDAFYDSIANLKTETDAQKFIQSDALQLSGSVRKTRSLMIEQVGYAIPWPFLAIMVFWNTILFIGFGLFSRFNATVTIALIVGALSVSGAMFLILELSDPYRGLLQIPDTPLRDALAQMNQ
jgi:hypothetical protein